MVRIQVCFNFWKLLLRHAYEPENESYDLFGHDSFFRNEQNNASRVNIFFDFLKLHVPEISIARKRKKSYEVSSSLVQFLVLYLKSCQYYFLIFYYGPFRKSKNHDEWMINRRCFAGINSPSTAMT